MSRVVKFRAWDIENKRWLDINEIVCDWSNTPWVDSMCVSGDTDFELRSSMGSIVWVQFTGLKDKNGTEIYEGDLLSHKFYSRPVVVTFDNGSFQAEDVSMFSDSIEVIGNIYENPELPDQKGGV